MHKSPLALFAAIAASTLALASNAEAGRGIRLGFGGPLPSFVAHGGGGDSYSPPSYRKRYAESCHKRAKAKSYASQHKSSEPKVAKVESVSKRKIDKQQAIAEAPIAEADAAAASENSSIAASSEVAIESTAKPKTVKTAEVKTDTASLTKPAPEKTASKLDCKKFFPTVGMTLSVPCE